MGEKSPSAYALGEELHPYPRESVEGIIRQSLLSRALEGMN
ncbi:hypothetical protein M6D81_22475 [Paenibacillus sp. J5C_2022]|nr:hypothetical protein [Paenibacillus sp. J5C2022]